MKNGFKIFDSDLHVIESPNIYEDYIDPRFRDQAPRWTRHPEHGKRLAAWRRASVSGVDRHRGHRGKRTDPDQRW